MNDNKDQDKAMIGLIALGLFVAYIIGTGLIELAKAIVSVFS